MFMIWDSRQQDWQLFWLSFEYWCHWSFDPWWFKISGHSEQLEPCGSTSHFVNNRHSRVKTQGASCIGGFGQTNGRRKFELGIPKSRGTSYNRGMSYIREKTVYFKYDIFHIQFFITILHILSPTTTTIHYCIQNNRIWNNFEGGGVRGTHPGHSPQNPPLGKYSTRVNWGNVGRFLDHSIRHVIARDSPNPTGAFHTSTESVDSLVSKYRPSIINALVVSQSESRKLYDVTLG